MLNKIFKWKEVVFKSIDYEILLKEIPLKKFLTLSKSLEDFSKDQFAYSMSEVFQKIYSYSSGNPEINIFLSRSFYFLCENSGAFYKYEFP